ncbi:cytochrome P450 [Rhodococcus koreensis]
MSEAPPVDQQGALPLPAVRLPPAPRIPKAMQSIAFTLSRRRTMENIARRYGKAFTLNLPLFGGTVVIADPGLAKQIFTANPTVVGNIQPNLSRVLGPGSVFALDGADHRKRRRLLTPPFHGKSIKNYEQIIEEETLHETVDWPEGKEFETLEPMMRITLNVILRAVFGADGAELDELRRLIPPWVTLSSRLAVLPTPKRTYGRYTPWGQAAEKRSQYDAIIDKLINNAESDPILDDRTDVLAMMLRNTYEDGSVMSRQDIGDELLTLLAAGHETTASTLAWAFERLSRHPEALTALASEADTDDSELRQAAILEVQRTATVIDFAGRHVYAPVFEIGEWVIPQGYSIMVSISAIHKDAAAFPDPRKFDPQRFVGVRPDTNAWIPFGGGTRRCVGATFVNMEMDVVLRTILRHFDIETTTAPDEKWHSRGVAFTPKNGGRIVVHRRNT